MNFLKSVNSFIKDYPYLFGTGVVCIAGLISFVLDNWFLSTQGVLLILQLAVLVTALSGNKKIAIFAGILSGVAFNYFFTSPRFSFHMTDVNDIGNLFIFLIVAIITSYLSAFYKEQREALEKAELRASILMSVSHDLRTPLSTIIGTLSTMLEYEERLPKSAKEELLQGALEESHRLHRYIENLLQAVKLQHGIKLNFIEQSVIPIIKSAVERFNTDRINLELCHDYVNVNVSYTLLEQSIYNVIDNALKYSPSDSIVSVKVSSDSHSLYIDVIDEGSGIAPEYKDKIFQLFFSSRKGDTGQGGSGIGLTVTKGIIEAHNGTVSVLPDSNGCVIRMVLPLCNKEKT